MEDSLDGGVDPQPIRVEMVREVMRGLAIVVDHYQKTHGATASEVASAIVTTTKYVLEAVVEDSPAAQVVQNRNVVLKGLGEIYQAVALARPEIADEVRH